MSSTAPAAPSGAAARPAQDALVVGFDLDMTLIDSRPGIQAVYELLSAETGVAIDGALAVTRLGPPVEQELAHWAPAERIAALADRYRELYVEHGVAGCAPLPGAREALAAVRALGGRTLVVTGKHTPNARLCLDAAGLDDLVDEVFGNVFAEQKSVVLRAEGAGVYVGDHRGDMIAARGADAFGVGVATGPYSAEELRAEGADAVLPDLTGFPAWLSAHRAAAPR